MPIVFVKVDGHPQCYHCQNGVVLTPAMRVDVPEIEQLKELTKDELKSLLETSGLKMTKIGKADKHRVCSIILENWDMVLPGMSDQWQDTITTQPVSNTPDAQASTSTSPDVQASTSTKVMTVKIVKGDNEPPMTFELDVRTTLVSDLLDLYEAETGISKEQVAFFTGIKPMEHFRRIEEYVEGNTFDVSVRPKLQGGGKRGASGASKQSKSKKVEDLFESIETTSIFSKETALTYKNALSMLRSNPSEVLNASLGQFTIENFQRFQVALTSGNTDFKTTAFGKEVFRANFDNVETLRRECDNLQRGMSDIGTVILLLSQFGNEDGSISWTPLSELVSKGLTEKSKASVVPTAPTG